MTGSMARRPTLPPAPSVCRHARCAQGRPLQAPSLPSPPRIDTARGALRGLAWPLSASLLDKRSVMPHYRCVCTSQAAGHPAPRKRKPQKKATTTKVTSLTFFLFRRKRGSSIIVPARPGVVCRLGGEIAWAYPDAFSCLALPAPVGPTARLTLHSRGQRSVFLNRLPSLLHVSLNGSRETSGRPFYACVCVRACASASVDMCVAVARHRV